MQRFFRDRGEVAVFLGQLPEQVCPCCGAKGAFVRHGFIRGALSPTTHGIRGWRVFCDPDSPHGRGCGWAPALWLSDTLLHRCFTADQLLLFIFALMAGLSISGSWQRSGIGMSLDTAYRLHTRLRLCQSILRTQLCSRSPPKRKRAGSPLLQAFNHLQETFGSIRAYQEELQRDFLALA